MANPTRSPGTGVRLDRSPSTNTPRWVKAFAIIAIVLVVLFVIAHLTGISGGGLHGLTDLAPFASLVERGELHP